MERLTRHEGEKVIVKSKSDNLTIGTLNDIAKKLASYEDTGLEPSEIDTLKERVRLMDSSEEHYVKLGNKHLERIAVLERALLNAIENTPIKRLECFVPLFENDAGLSKKMGVWLDELKNSFINQAEQELKADVKE